MGLHRRRNNSSLVFVYSVAIIVMILFAYPFVWMVLSSFKTLPEISVRPWAVPRRLLLSNYAEAWKAAEFGTALSNSVGIAVSSVILVLALSTLSAYAFAELEFSSKNTLFLIVIGALMVPVQTIIIPLFIFLKKLHLSNTYLGLVFSQVALGIPLSVFILTGFFKEVPKELLLAAEIDGCSKFSSLMMIVLPLSKPALSSVIIFQFLGSWNNFLMPLVLLPGRQQRTIPLAVQVFVGEYRVEYNYQFSVLALAIVPVLIVYFIFQKQFIQGLASGAIKE